MPFGISSVDPQTAVHARSGVQVRTGLPAGGKWIRTFGSANPVDGTKGPKVRIHAPLTGSRANLDITEAPEAVDIVLINRPELRPAGAGESSIRPVAAALGSASPSQSGC